MSSETTLERAMKDADNGKLDAALSSVRLLIKRKPQDLDAVQIFGMLLMKAGEMAQAIHHLGRAVARRAIANRCGPGKHRASRHQKRACAGIPHNQAG